MGLPGRINEALVQVERAAVWIILVLMGLIMFLAVAHRPAIAMINPRSAPDFFLSAFGEEAWINWGGMLGMFFIASSVAVLALRTRGSLQSLPFGLGIGAGITVFERIFVSLFPNGIVQAQPIALSLLLWLSLLGASLAAYDRRHLSVDFGSKLWPEAMRPKVAAISQVVTAVFCLVLCWLGVRSTGDQFHMWVNSDGAAAVLSGTAIPRWFAVSAIPYGMLTLSFRFSLEAVKAWRNDLEEVDELHLLGIKSEPAANAPSTGGGQA